MKSWINDYLKGLSDVISVYKEASFDSRQLHQYANKRLFMGVFIMPILLILNDASTSDTLQNGVLWFNIYICKKRICKVYDEEKLL